MQERRNSIANTLELRLSCTKPSAVETLYSTIYYSKYFIELNFDTQYVAFWTHFRASYGVSFMSTSTEIDRVIKGFYCILRLTHMGISQLGHHSTLVHYLLLLIKETINNSNNFSGIPGNAPLAPGIGTEQEMFNNNFFMNHQFWFGRSCGNNVKNQ